MDAYQENRHSSLIKTQSYLGDKAADFSPVPMIATEKLVLDSLMQGIVVNDGIATDNTTGYATAKENARIALVASTMRMVKAGKAQAAITDDEPLMSLMSITKSQLNTMRDSDLYVKSKRVSDALTPIIGSLAPFMVLPSHLAVLDTNINTYYITMPQPSTVTDLKKVAGKNVDELMASAFKLLKTRIDIFVDLFEADFPDLVEGYYLARAIDDMTGGGGGGGGTGLEFTGTVNAMSNGTTGTFAYNGAAAVEVGNLSGVDLKVQLMQGAMPVGANQTVAANGVLNSTLGAFGPNGDNFRIMNEHPTQSVSYKITVG